MKDFLSLVLDTDSYKFSHWVQYPPNTTGMFSYLESRGGKWSHTVFFGLQYYLKEYLTTPVTMEQVEEAKEFCSLHGEPFNYEGWKYIVEKHGGYLPVKIKAVPEGSVIPVSNIMMSVESTDPKVFWVVSYIETMLVRLWYPITVATQSWQIKQMISKYMEETGGAMEGVLFKLHDFGSRGVSSRESAMLGGAAHLVNFRGSDTVAGIWMANKYYDEPMAGFSIPASEHSTMTMWGRENEWKAYANMLNQYKDSPLFACVSDSYDIYNAAENLWGRLLKGQVENRDGMVVIRPDSGDPVTVVAALLDILAERFGFTTNEKGYRILNHVRILQGDGVNYDSIKDLLEATKSRGYSVDNIAFGMGGALLQQLNRDTQKFAFKCSWAEIDGKSVDVYKSPATDSGKNSKRGRLDLELVGDGVRTVAEGTRYRSLLEVIFENGKILKEYSLKEVRSNTEKFYNHTLAWTDGSVIRK